jgi:hypothetical protein
VLLIAFAAEAAACSMLLDDVESVIARCGSVRCHVTWFRLNPCRAYELGVCASRFLFVADQ